ncbi:uncharacterized protein LOC121736359 isoform X1 [Aricia agestis]|uniref:uncharacterized protein LOC121736359 isoform X1 n=2 Tax=Aricia agestis TaxID=91739 RepID=UPI001C207FFC|nr:uncharacterized protein LOC121736359 isoform X1 [Aricia agestis]
MAKRILLLLLHLCIYSSARLVNRVPETLHRILSGDVIRNALDKFTMVKRETYTHTPEFYHSIVILDNKNTVEEKNLRPADETAKLADDTNDKEKKIVYPKDITRRSKDESEYANTKLEKYYVSKTLKDDRIHNSVIKTQTKVGYSVTSEHSTNNNNAITVNFKNNDLKTLFSGIIKEDKSKTKNRNNEQNSWHKTLLPEINNLSDKELRERRDKINRLLKSNYLKGMNGKEPEIRRVLQKQNELIEALTQAQDSSSEDEQFLDIMESIDKKKSTKQPTTMVMIDQIDVRQALYNDPLVRRILKLAQRKNIQNRA